MRIGVPKEPEGSPLVSATPDTVAKLLALGHDVVVESGAGCGASMTDQMYLDAGAEVAGPTEAWGADLVTAVDPPKDIDRLHAGQVFLARLAPARSTELVEWFASRGVTALAMDAIPRISRAQSMDVLSSQANIAGYRAVVEAAHVFGRLFTGQVTAAGKVPPAKVYVIGAGVAGLAAIGTANSMGAVVSATDVREEVGEQVESMGATFVPIPAPAQESSDGYATEMSAEQAAAAATLYAQQAAAADIVITTANIPGRTSPMLLDARAVADMKPGSVIVDMAAANGGNTELTVPDRTIITDNGVTIVGATDLASRLPAQSSQLYGQNVVNFLKLTTPGKDGQFVLDLSDEIVRGVTVAHDGRVLWPPPPVQVSALDTGTVATGSTSAEGAATQTQAHTQTNAQAAAKKRNRALGLAIAVLLLAALVLVTPAAITAHYMVLLLAIIVGFYVITGVTHALHTPLMSVTNAISGIIVVGALLQIGSANPVVQVLSFVAIVLASINIFGGFTVTHRMLAMFRRD